jgi:hypothetical protein
MRYLLRVNGSKVLEHIAFHDRQLILMEDIEDRAKYLLARPESGINGREFKWMSRTIKYRVDHPQDTWQYCALEDFSDAEGMRLFDGMDRHVKRYSDVTKLNFRIELRVQIDSTQKASPENQVANELSGPRLADTTLPGNTCPNNAASIPDWGWIQQALQRIENKLTVDPSTPRGRKRRNSALSRSDYDEEEAEFEEHRRRINSRRYRNQLEDDLEDLEEAQRAVHRNRMDRLHLQNLRINRQIALELAPMHVPMFMPPAQQYQAR